jgi:hypothetical protein
MQEVGGRGVHSRRCFWIIPEVRQLIVTVTQGSVSRVGYYLPTSQVGITATNLSMKT